MVTKILLFIFVISAVSAQTNGKKLIYKFQTNNGYDLVAYELGADLLRNFFFLNHQLY